MVKFEELKENEQVAAIAGELSMLFMCMIYFFPCAIYVSIINKTLSGMWHEAAIVALAFVSIMVVSSTSRRLRAWLFSRTYKIALGFFKEEKCNHA